LNHYYVYRSPLARVCYLSTRTLTHCAASEARPARRLWRGWATLTWAGRRRAKPAGSFFIEN